MMMRKKDYVRFAVKNSIYGMAIALVMSFFTTTRRTGLLLALISASIFMGYTIWTSITERRLRAIEAVVFGMILVMWFTEEIVPKLLILIGMGRDDDNTTSNSSF
jgi:general stress protein CsbA